MNREPYRIAVTFNRDTLPGPDGEPEKYLIVNYDTTNDKFWIAYRAEAMAEYLTSLIVEVGDMGGDYTDTVIGAIQHAVTRYTEEGRERLRDAFKAVGVDPE